MAPEHIEGVFAPEIGMLCSWRPGLFLLTYSARVAKIHVWPELRLLGNRHVDELEMY